MRAKLIANSENCSLNDAMTLYFEVGLHIDSVKCNKKDSDFIYKKYNEIKYALLNSDINDTKNIINDLFSLMKYVAFVTL